jgi:hypothetical protein
VSGRAPRAAEVAENLERIRRRIATACARTQRSPEEVRIIAVTKTRPAGDVALVAGAGLSDIGENRAGELAEKAEQCGEIGLTWHFVGQLQTNKAGVVARWADTRRVPQVAFKPDWTKHAKAAPFKRNDAMLTVLPIGVIVFPGTGIQENLVDKARKLGIPVWRFGGA